MFRTASKKRAKVLVVEDDRDVLNEISKILEAEFDVETSESAEHALELFEHSRFDAVLCDLKLPRMSGLELLEKVRQRDPDVPFIIITAFGDIPTAVKAMKLGATDFIRKGDITFRELLGKLKSAMEKDEYEAPVFVSEKMKKVFALAKRVAKTDATVLITGETGVGKEVLARFIHFASPRAYSKFVAVNLPAIPENLVESELFGYEKGAFTGAESRKAGKFELAHRGTLLLDEIGDMPLELQPKLLRAIQTKEIEPLGSTRPVKVDVRIICATNRDLQKLVKEGKFREDLYFRISVFPIHIPPLRERREDIVPLALHFLKKFNRKYMTSLEFSPEALKKLEGWDWPGNVRELENVVERAVLLCADRKLITPDDIIFSPDEMYESEFEGEEKSSELPASESFAVDDLNIKNMEKVFIIRALERTGGNKTEAAKLLGITPRTLRNKLKEYGLWEKFRKK